MMQMEREWTAQAVCRGDSSATNARQAAAELYAAVAQPHMELVIFFCSSLYDLDE